LTLSEGAPAIFARFACGFRLAGRGMVRKRAGLKPAPTAEKTLWHPVVGHGIADENARSRSERIVPLEFEPLDQYLQRRKKLTEIEALG
jgi:hypothetical protein